VVAPSGDVEVPRGRLRLASPRIALVLGVAVVVAIGAQVPLAIAGHGEGSVGIVALMIPFGIVGAVVARRQPSNPIGFVLLLLIFAVAVSSDAGQYALLRYRDGYTGLPFGRVAVFLAPGVWMWLVVLLPLPLVLFPDGRLTRRWRRLLWPYFGLGAVFVVISFWQSTSGILAPDIQVDSKGQLASGNPPEALSTAYPVVILLYLGFGLVWALRLALSYRRSTGEYRQQLKWLLAGGALAVIGLMLEFSLGSSSSQFARAVGNAGLLVSLLALPISLGVSILKYRLYEIDRLISRTISYLLVTGVLVGVFVGLVVLTTRVLPFSSPVGVAASTLAAAALFNPLRLRVQRLVDRRFNRARYDAEATVAAFRLRLREAVDIDTVQRELLRAVDSAVEPAHTSLWIRPSGSGSRR